MARLVLEAVDKVYPGGVRAVDGFSLDVADGELLALVGPSGCGKTTLLRLIAGLDSPTAGAIALGGRSLNGVSPRDRDVAMAFQGHALYPHLTAYGNIAFPLKLRRYARAEIDRRVRAAAELLGIGPLLDRKPRQLSGGQQQRVALGRAIVRQPACFLLDEPLSNLDARLREQMRREWKGLHQRLQTTTVYVTHDQSEAMALGGRVAIMRHGRLQQVGTPQEVYQRPANGFVAAFLGTPPMSFLHGTLEEDAGRLWFRHGQQPLAVPPWAVSELRRRSATSVVLGFRPEVLSPSPIEGQTDNEIRAVVALQEFLGDHWTVHLQTPGDRIAARLNSTSPWHVGEEIRLFVDYNHVHFFEPPAAHGDEPGKNLYEHGAGCRVQGA